MTLQTRHSFKRLFDEPTDVPPEFLGMPSDYLSFLRSENGILYSPSLLFNWEDAMLLPTTEDDNFATIDVLYGFKQNALYDLRGWQNFAWFDLWNRGNMVAIGGTTSFSTICISMREVDFGAIFYWFVPLGPPDGKSDAENSYERFLNPIAPDFEEFLRRLELNAISDPDGIDWAASRWDLKNE